MMPTSTHRLSTVLLLLPSDLVTLWYRVFSSKKQRNYHIITDRIYFVPSLVEEDLLERKTTSSIPLSSTFFNPELMYVPGELDKFLVGLATQPRQKFDNVVSEQLTNHLFQGKNKEFGMDLVALNIQRGRDHGLPGGNNFYKQ